VCSVFVTAQTAEAEELLGEVADALGAVGVDAAVHERSLRVDGAPVTLDVATAAHPTPVELAELAQRTGAQGRHRPVVVVADRISEPGREVLRRAGWGWFDRRGHVRVWAPGVRIEAPLPAPDRRDRTRLGNPWTQVGLEVALAALLHPDDPVTARRVAPVIGRSVGAVHELVRRFAEVGLIGRTTHQPLLPELFWETAAQWPDDGWLALPVGLDQIAAKLGGETLVRVDERAATLGGARIAAAGDLPARAYLPSAAALRRVRSLVQHEAPTRCWVRTAPVTCLPENTEHPPSADHPWRVAHPIVCALRLAADPARGREVVESWGIVPGAAR
jgi:hypothetical protein